MHLKMLPTGCGSPSFQFKKKNRFQYKHRLESLHCGYPGTVKLRNGPHSYFYFSF